MKVIDLKDKIPGQLIGSQTALEREVEGVFIGDLLSLVMANGEAGQAWITILGHLNVIAVATLNEFSLVIVAQDAKVEKQVLDKALAEDIAVLCTSLSAFDIAKIFVQAGY